MNSARSLFVCVLMRDQAETSSSSVQPVHLIKKFILSFTSEGGAAARYASLESIMQSSKSGRHFLEVRRPVSKNQAGGFEKFPNDVDGMPSSNVYLTRGTSGAKSVDATGVGKHAPVLLITRGKFYLDVIEFDYHSQILKQHSTIPANHFLCTSSCKST